MKLLLVEDNRELSFWMMRLLEQSGYAVEQAFTGGDALQFLMTQSYDAILLDLALPDMQGRAILKRVRDRHDEIPVLIVSAMDALQDIVGHLDLGADDYLVKPINILELEARLRSLLRRATGRAHPVFECGGLHYDTNSKIFSSGGTALSLTPREHAVLEALIRYPGRTVSKKELADRLCTLDDAVSEKALEIYVVRLRKKIENTSARIVTLRGLGYMLTAYAAD